MSRADEGVDLTFSKEGDRVRISGVFRVAVDEQRDHHEMGQRALVLVAAHRSSHTVCRPFDQRVPMSDDSKRVGGLTTGAFSLDLSEYVPSPMTGTYHVLMSIGSVVSEILTIEA